MFPYLSYLRGNYSLVFNLLLLPPPPHHTLTGQDPVNTVNQCKLPEGENVVLWQYEHLRQIAMQLNDLVVSLSKQCSKTSCPMMHATDKYEFRCAAHKNVQDVSCGHVRSLDFVTVGICCFLIPHITFLFY